MHIPGRKNRFPLWLSAPLRVRIQRLREDGKCADWAPSEWIGIDEQGNYHGLSWMGIKGNCGVFARSAMRSQMFPVELDDVLDELLMFQIYEELTLVLEGKANPTSKGEFRMILAEFKAKYNIIRSQVTSF